MSKIEIQIKNCNNIDCASISLEEKKLNIKFAPNGTGKSSIARAILLYANGGNDSLSDLMPFKFRKENDDNTRPEVEGSKALKNIMCFNEEYVNQFTFKPDELLSNSFDIFIRNNNYKQKEEEIEALVHNIKKLFIGNQELEDLITNLKEIGSAFKISQSGLSKTTTGMKALSSGNKIKYVPPGLEPYTPFIQSESSVNWIDWQTKGYVFAKLSENCPFCTSHTADKKEQIKKVGQEYDKSVIKNLIALIAVIEKLGDYFSDEAKSKLTQITLLKDGIEKEHENFLLTVKKQIDTFTEKLEKLRTLSAFQFRDGEKVGSTLPTYILDLQFFSELNSQKMREAITPINASINEVIKQAGQLQGKINQQRHEMNKLIELHQNNINNFLAYAGYRYKVEIAGEGDHAQLKLQHIDYKDYISGGAQYLSFGEKNAFAIVLFMYECLAKNTDLIILDDPISSFDKNKKYAILEMLFHRTPSECLKNKTVLMLTHDVEPIIDTIKSLKKEFSSQTSSAFLKLSKGNITELIIKSDDIQTFPQICDSVINSEKDDIIKLIYMRRRHEINNSKGDAYQVLSNIFHKRLRPVDTRLPQTPENTFPEMAPNEFTNGCTEIQREINSFSYEKVLHRITDTNTLKDLYHKSKNGYEKLQIFRLLDIDPQNSVIKKFINESYHIENEFICQLNPEKFDTTPEYITLECEKILEKSEEQ